MAKEIVENIFKNFDPSIQGDETVERKPVTLWLPVDYKERFGNLQSKTKCKFGKEVQKMMMQAIDLADRKAS